MTERAAENGGSTAKQTADRRAAVRDDEPDPGKTATRSTRSRSAASDGAAPRKRTRPRSLAARQAARLATGHVLELTGHQPENVVSIAKNDDGWRVGVEVVELRRIPDTADILAVYELVLDTRGELVSYSRERRYHRGSTERD